MRISAACEPGSPAVPNEDWWGATSRAVVVLDGVTLLAGMTAGCTHGTPWYVAQLGSRLLAGAEDTSAPLSVILGHAIAEVAALHPECDLASVGAPSAAVAMLRLEDDVEYLALADVTILLETDEGIRVVTDNRVSSSVASVDPAAPDVGLRVEERRVADRNRPGGYWVAAADPEAAAHAVTGSVPASGLGRAAVMTDGASRLVDMLGIAWERVAEMDAPSVISEVRAAELLDAARTRWPRFKVSDDATIVFVG
jgi:hypothetical protein